MFSYKSKRFHPMIKFATQLETAKQKYETSAMEAMTARLDYLYNYAKDVKVEEKKAVYIRLRDEYKRLKQEFEDTVAVPNEWEKTGITKETLQKATLRLPVEGNTSAYRVQRDMEERLWKAKYRIPTQGSLPPVNHLYWIDE
jgi:hypothetical protein